MRAHSQTGREGRWTVTRGDEKYAEMDGDADTGCRPICWKVSQISAVARPSVVNKSHLPLWSICAGFWDVEHTSDGWR